MQTNRFIAEKIRDDIGEYLDEKKNSAENLVQGIIEENRRIKVNL